MFPGENFIFDAKSYKRNIIIVYRFKIMQNIRF